MNGYERFIHGFSLCKGRISSADFHLCRNRVSCSEFQDFLDVVNHAVQHPLNVDLGPASQGEPIHPLTRSYITEDRFDYAQPFAVDFPALRRVDLGLHCVGYASRPTAEMNVYLSGRSFFTAQTF